MVSWKNSMENQWMILPGVPQLFYQLMQKNFNTKKKTPKGLFYGENILYYTQEKRISNLIHNQSQIHLSDL